MPPLAAVTAAGALGIATALVGWLDVLSGPDYGLSLFYLLPVTAGGWFYGRRVAIALAVEAAALWFWADVAERTALVLPASVWNGSTRLAIFTAMGVGAAMLRRDRNLLRELVQRERLLARTDPLTGLANGRSFRERLCADLVRAERHGIPICVLFFDIDNFKRINDTHGHEAGDGLLVNVAKLLQQATREGDVVARLGGDEFVAALWAADAAAGERVARRVVAAVEELGRRFPDAELGASAGVAESRGAAQIDVILREADQALYRAKAAGKGTVFVAGSVSAVLHSATAEP